MKYLFIMHPGKAAYPEIKAYESFFEKKYIVISGTEKEYNNFKFKSRCILWCIMGIYLKNYECMTLIHDYRSLSIGSFSGVKDLLKKKLNQKPFLRIFQNEQIENVMNFKDDIPSIHLGMGVPDFAFSIEDKLKNEYSSDFCYIGVMSKERNFDKVLEAFIKNIHSDKTISLIGKPEKFIFDKFSKYKNIKFIGEKPQNETLKIVASCNFAISFCPDHRPYCYQDPTKLLEYAALNKNILCNPSISNKRVVKNLELNVIFGGNYIFDEINEIENYISNNKFNKNSLKWESIIKKSGINTYLQRIK